MYITKLRKELIDVFANTEFIDFKSISSKISVDSKPNKTTIYRQLDLLEKEGLIISMYILGRCFWANRNHKNHSHFVCNKCSINICLNIDNPLIDNIRKQTERLFDYSGLRLEGLCNECK